VRNITISIAFGLVALVNPNPATAQTMQPLSEILAVEYEQTYPLIRCAAFYQSSIEWAGKKRIGQTTFERYNDAIKNLLALSVFLRSQKSKINIENAQEITLRDTRKISDLYLKRYKINYATTGQAWGSDTMWKGDLQICQKMATSLQ